MLTHERLREVLRYDPETGVFTWLVKPRKRELKNAEAGCINAKGYRQIGVDGKLYRSNRLAWFYVTGTWPTAQIDHENQVRADDRFANLREATHSQNQANSKVRKASRTGVKGVEQLPGGRFRAYIHIGNDKKHLGTFPTTEEAGRVFAEAHQKLHGEFSPKA